MVVQTFGNRILGGVGAPGGGMSEAFGAGVGTALNQRDARQVMDFRAQDQAFQIEDRKIAAQQRAAAAAAAASARAKLEAYNAEIARISGVGTATAPPILGLTLPVTRGESRDRREPFVNPPYYPTAPVVTAPTAGTVTYKSPKLSFSLGAPAAPTAAAPSMGGANAETRREVKLGAPAAPAVTAQAPAPGGVRTATAPAPAVVATGAVGNMQFVMPKDSKIWTGIKAGGTVTLTPSGRGYTVTLPGGQKVALNKDTAAELLAEQGSSIETVLAAQAPAPAVTPLPTFTLSGGVKLTLNPDGSSSVTYPNGAGAQNSKSRTDRLLRGAGTTAEEVRASQTPAPAVTAALPTFELAFGGELTLNPDGSSSVTYPNGTVAQNNKDQTDTLLQSYDTTAEEVRASQTPAPAVTAAPAAPSMGGANTGDISRSVGAVGNNVFVMPANSKLYSEAKAGTVISVNPSTGQGTATINGKYVIIPKGNLKKLLEEQGSTLDKVTKATAAPAAAAPAPLAGTGEPVYSDALGVIVLQPNGVLTLDGQPVPPSDPMYNAVSNEYTNLRKRQLIDTQSTLATESNSPLVYADPLAYSTRVAAAKQAEAAAQAAVGAAPIQYPVYDGRTDVPVGQLPAGVRAPVTETQTVTTAAAPSSMDFGVGFGVGQTPLSFGPRLGVTPQTQEDMMIDEFVTQTTVAPTPAAVAGQATPPAVPVQPLPNMGKPGQPNYVITGLLSERNKRVQVIQAQLDAGMTSDAIATQTELAAIDSKLQAAVGQLAIEELRDYNAPQRINEIWTQMKQGRKYEFVPLNDGNVAVYVDGKLQIESTSMDKIIEATLSMTNQTYVEQQAELAAIQAKAFAESQGTSLGTVDAANQKAAFAGDIAVLQADQIADIKVAEATGVNLAATMQKIYEYELQRLGRLPQEARNYEYRDMGDGSVGIFEGGQLLRYLYVVEVAGPPGADGTPTTMPVIREQVVGQ